MKDVPLYHLNRHAEEWLVKFGSWPGGQSVYGHELESGDVLTETDVYDSTSGSWTPCPCPGLTLQSGSAAKWVRPVKS